MKNTTKIKIREIAQKIFFEEIHPNLEDTLVYSTDKECVIKGIEKGLMLALQQGRKW